VRADSGWETFLARDVVRAIDARYRTIRSGSARALGGLSEGGYGSLNVGLHHPGEFRVLESWSGYERADKILSIFGRGKKRLAYNSPRSYVSDVASRLRRGGTDVWFYSSPGTLGTRQSDRAIAGLSAGAFGAVDIALRHSGIFGVAESWSGYFRPFRDGPLAHASSVELADHDPTVLVRREAALLRRQHVRFYLATGFNHGGIFRRWTYEFARELHDLRLPYRVWASKSPDGGRYLRLQLPAALVFAFRPD
jgi:enterochelin esterase-like enzyme